MALLVAECDSTTQGRAVSPLYDPFRAGGLLAQDGPSGIRENGPAPQGDVKDGDGSDADKLATLAVNDVAEVWETNYAESFDGSFTAGFTRIFAFRSVLGGDTDLCHVRFT